MNGKKNNSSYKVLIFSRYIGQFIQANDTDAKYRKSSEEIAFELSGMAYFSIDEISELMISFDYKIGFDDSKPVWLLKEDEEKRIAE